MSIDEQRRNALEELRDMLSDGADPADAVAEVSRSSGLRPDVVAKIGDRLIAEQDKLVSEKRFSYARADRKRRADQVIKLYEEALMRDPSADLLAIEGKVQIDDFSKDELSSLHFNALNSWLFRQVRN